MNNEDCHMVSSNKEINLILEETAKECNIKITKGDTVCTECFDAYMMDISKFFERFPKDFKPLGAEMECFALFYTAKVLNKRASSIISVVDSKYIDKIATPEERQTGLTNMIKLALESAIKI
jgi:purine-nucleoside phosphorylase